MTALNKHAELRKELSNPATGSKDHLRKLALSLLDELETKDTEIEWMRKRIEELAKALEVSENHRATWYVMADKLGDSLDVSEKRVAELERANAAQDDHINQQQDRIDMLEKRNAGLGREVIRLQSLKTVSAALQEAESEFHRGYSCGHKDASLESRTVTVKLPQRYSMLFREGFSEDYRTEMAYSEKDIQEMLAAAGIQVIEGEGQ
jgi:uncharacterized protein (DUF3084 family)